jgi:predicted RNA-binding protein YlqC (UPF0109 family)
MRPLLEFVARALVDDPGAVQVHEVRAAPTAVYRLHVAAADVGKVIGKHGRTAHALRLLLAATAARDGRRAVLEIEE